MEIAGGLEIDEVVVVRGGYETPVAQVWRVWAAAVFRCAPERVKKSAREAPPQGTWIDLASQVCPDLKASYRGLGG